MRFPLAFAGRRGAMTGTLAVGLALGLSTLGVVRAERVKPDKIFRCSSGICLQGIDSNFGTGVLGKAPAGDGVFGEVYSANNPSYNSAGVEGYDKTGLANSSGVYGVSSVGSGVYGAASSNGYGVYATSAAGTAIYGTITGTSSHSAALWGVDGTNTTINRGVVGYSVNGSGVWGESANGDAVVAIADNPGVNVLHAIGSFTSGGYVIIDGLGNIYASGKIYTVGSCHAGCARTKDTDRRVVSYTPRESLPSMEDTGESRLVDGRAYVRFDPALANVIDSGAVYSVLITPEGDSRGLYVTQKSSNGFAVRENQAGRSTLSFAYRIVAKPYADVSSRLPMRTFPIHTNTSAHHLVPPSHVAH